MHKHQNSKSHSFQSPRPRLPASVPPVHHLVIAAAVETYTELMKQVNGLLEGHSSGAEWATQLQLLSSRTTELRYPIREMMARFGKT